ncbi:MAG: hypothetical protein PHO91_01055 [Patescibacteria group bacterium]|nr:hypothetical protein [Patescibacteria group bacterium]
MAKKQAVARDPFYPDTLMYSFVYGLRYGAKMILKESLAQCLAHLKARSLEAGKLKYLVDEMSGFIGVHQSTVRRWLLGEQLPRDKRLICLQYYVSCLGYQLIELEGMPSLLCRLREAVAWGQLSLEKMTKELGLTSSEVLDILTGSGWRRLDGKASLVFKLRRLIDELYQAEEEEMIEALDQLPDMAGRDYYYRRSRQRRRRRP